MYCQSRGSAQCSCSLEVNQNKKARLEVGHARYFYVWTRLPVNWNTVLQKSWHGVTSFVLKLMRDM